MVGDAVMGCIPSLVDDARFELAGGAHAKGSLDPWRPRAGNGHCSAHRPLEGLQLPPPNPPPPSFIFTDGIRRTLASSAHVLARSGR
jgi:hypothetical protein